MAYQTIPVAKSIKAGLPDLESKGAVWVHGTYEQGLKFLNLGGKTVLIARSETAAAADFATWDTTHVVGTYAAMLEKEATATDRSTHVQVTLDTGITVEDFCTEMDTPTVAWSFAHWIESADGVQNGPQLELRFEDPDSDAWLEITVVPLQGTTGTDAYVTEAITSADECGYGGNTPNGSSVFEWAGLTSLTALLAAINAAWETAEQDTVVSDYELVRVRVELWEADPARTVWIDTLIINGTTYALEPGLAGVSLGPNAPLVTLTFVKERDKFGRTETLTPLLGASQSLIVGPFLPALFNDTSGYVRFKPDTTGNDLYYSAIQVTDPS